MSSKTKNAIVNNLRQISGQISCSAELSMKQNITSGPVYNFIIDRWWPFKDTIKLFNPSFQDSFFASQKTSSISTKE